MSKLATLADIHLGKRQNSTDFNRQAVEIVGWLLDHCKKEKIRYGAFCGDWFNDRITVNSRTLHHSAEAFAMINDYFKSVDGKWFQIVGNHDLYYRHSREVSSVSFLKGYSHIEVIDTPTDVDIDGHIVSMFPWLNDNDDIPKIIHDAKGEYLFCHGEFRNFKWNANSVMLTGGLPCDMVSKFKKVYSGHYHLRQSKDNITYLGSPQHQDFGDVGTERGFTVIDLSTGEEEFIENNTSSRYYIIKLSELNDNLNLIKDNCIKIIEDVELHSDEFNTIHSALMKKNPLSLHFETMPKKEEDVVEVSDEDIESIESLLFNLLDGDRSEERKSILREKL